MSEELIEYQVNGAELELWKVDQLIEEVKENNKTIERLKEITDGRIAELKDKFEHEKEKLLKQNSYRLTTLGEYAKEHEGLKSSKTQYSLKLLSGNIVIKKPIPKVSKPDKGDVDEIEKLYPEFVERVEDKKVNWKDLKKKFIIQSDKIYDQESGEDVSGIFGIEVNEEEIIVK